MDDQIVGAIEKEEKQIIKLTEADRLVLTEMNRGYYLIYVKDTEWLSVNGLSKTTILKAGTIKRLMEYGLIEVSTVNYTRHLLTDKGREFR